MNKRKTIIAVVLAAVAAVAVAAATCPHDGFPLRWTGETHVSEYGKILKVYECSAGHRVLGN